jgi:esterase/lipase superfamily enzyme
VITYHNFIVECEAMQVIGRYISYITCNILERSNLVKLKYTGAMDCNLFVHHYNLLKTALSVKPRRSCQDMTKQKYTDFHFLLAAQINMMTSPIKMSHNRNTTLKWCVFHLLGVLPNKDNLFAALHIKAAPFLSEHISKDAPVALSCAA